MTNHFKYNINKGVITPFKLANLDARSAACYQRRWTISTRKITATLITMATIAMLNSGYSQTQSALLLKGGAAIQGQILKVTPESVTLLTTRGELLIPMRSLEDSYRLRLISQIDSPQKKKEETPKEKSRLVSKLLEEKEIEAHKTEGDTPRIRFGRKDFVFRKYTHRGSEVDYIFTPIGENQVYDSEETLRLTYNKTARNPQQVKDEVEQMLRSLGGKVHTIPKLPGAPAALQQDSHGIDFTGIIKGDSGNPSKIVFGRVFSINGKYHTLLYARFTKDKNNQETEAWLERNFERLQTAIRGVVNLPEEQVLTNFSNKKGEKVTEPEDNEAADTEEP